MALLLLAAGFLGGAVWQAGTTPAVQHRTDATPRTVAPRADLKPEEQDTIGLFEAASPSVVFITSVTVRQDLFRRNVTEIPRGTGTGFVWDSPGPGHYCLAKHPFQVARSCT